MNKKIAFTTGGTGGHIYPALSVAKEYEKLGGTPIFIGTSHRMEKDIIPDNGYTFYGLDVIPLRSIKSLWKLTTAIFQSISILRKEKVDAIIGFGNYISLPTIIAGKILRKPIYLQEQNVVMGMANKYMYKGAKKTFLAFARTKLDIDKKYLSKMIVTGNPLREEFYNITKENARKELNRHIDDKIICIMGGSLGAKNINESVLSKLSKILEKKNLYIYWSTGKELYKDIVNRVESDPHLIISEYFENAHIVMAATDVIICRAGASTLSEIIELKIPSLLIPYNFVGQKENADVLEYLDATKIYNNDEVEEAIEEALRLINDEQKLNFMKNNLNNINYGNAGKIIAKDILEG